MATPTPDNADVIVALGGDGLMLEVLHTVLGTPKPVYGMNCGSVGFMMNEFAEAEFAGAHRAPRKPARCFRCACMR